VPATRNPDVSARQISVGGEISGIASSGDSAVNILVRAENLIGLAGMTATALSQLPPLPAGFTGRGHELAEMTKVLNPAEDENAAVVSAAGLAGVGKTALAIAAGHAARDRGWFAGGVLFIDLRGYDSSTVKPALALDALLRALGVPAEHIPPDTDQRAGLYRSVLAGMSEPLLVIADNASSSAQVRPLLPGRGPHRVVVTSRHTLAGLDARLLDIGVLDSEASTRLLDTLIRTARPDDTRISDHAEAADQLAQSCGGLPLALQIVAALLKADPGLAAAQLAAELDSEHERLERLRYDEGDESTALSVEAAFALSYRALTSESGRVFRLLSMAPGPDTSTSAVAALANLPAPRARRELADLARAHLIHELPVGAGRWQMHDLMHLYARRMSEQDDDAADKDQALERLLSHYLATAHAASQHMQTLPGNPKPPGFPDRAGAIAWLDAERPCLVAAVASASENNKDLVTVGLPLCLAGYLGWRRRFEDLITTCTLSMATAQRYGDQANEAAAAGNLGNALRELRRFDEAIATDEHAIALFRKTGDRRREAMVLGNLGLTLREVGKINEVIAAHQQAITLFREAGDLAHEATALNDIGAALQKAARYDDAVTAHQAAIAICRRTLDHRNEAMALNNLGGALQQQNRFDEAIRAHQDAIAIYLKTDDHFWAAAALTNMGNALRRIEGRLDEAITAHQDALTIYRKAGDRRREAMVLGNLGLTLREAHRLEDAITAHQDAINIYRQADDRDGEASALNDLGTALQHAGRAVQAVTMHQRASAIYREIGDRSGEGSALNNLGSAFRRASMPDEAIAAHQDAIAIFREIGDRGRELAALNNLEADEAPKN
jgi:tetratricopeptide (TPR) repeat protein